MRKKNSLLNMIGSLSTYFISIVFTFVTQSILIKKLGIEYNGINGLFTNILTMLQVAELGIGTTIIYKLYKPISENDIEKIKSWMGFYKDCYNIIAIFIAIIGLGLTPFIPSIVGEVSIHESVVILYIISLLDIVLSYCMTYKRSLLYASQKNYILDFIHIGYTIFMNVCQIICIILTKNYLFYLLIKLFYRILENVIINTFVDKKYKYIKEEHTPISKENKHDVIERVKAIFLQKVSFVINKGIDNVIISKVLGIVSVGYYTNYTLIINAGTSVIYQTVSAMTASVGDLLTEKNREKSYDVYLKINMFNSFITSMLLVGLFCCMDSFISIWIGDKYILNNWVLISFIIYVYSDGIRRSITLFKDAAGICKEDRNMYVIMALINLICSIILCKLIGMSGVILGTALSYIFLIVYSYPKYIFVPLFKHKAVEYHVINLKYLLYMIISLVTAKYITSLIVFNNSFINLLVYVFIAVIINFLVFIIMFFKTKEFKYYINFINKILKKRK